MIILPDLLPKTYPAFLAYDRKLMRPGCVLLQAVYGCDSRMAELFDNAKWLTSPTPDMQVWRLDNEDQVRKLVALTHP